jgi:hypothetical protein
MPWWHAHIHQRWCPPGMCACLYLWLCMSVCKMNIWSCICVYSSDYLFACLCKPQRCLFCLFTLHACRAYKGRDVATSRSLGTPCCSGSASCHGTAAVWFMWCMMWAGRLHIMLYMVFNVARMIHRLQLVTPWSFSSHAHSAHAQLKIMHSIYHWKGRGLHQMPRESTQCSGTPHRCWKAEIFQCWFYIL